MAVLRVVQQVKRRMHISELTALVLLLFVSCADAPQPEAAVDTGYLPEGVQRAEYKRHIPDGSNFQESRINPPFWWTDMVCDTLQILIYDRDVAGHQADIPREGIEVLESVSLESPNYLFVSVRITEEATPGRFPIRLVDGSGQLQRTFMYELKPRLVMDDKISPLSSDDLVYLVMPDRFANGDAANDSYDDMRQQGVSRDRMYFRHGGDIQGLQNHLDYISGLGASAIWPTPLLSNDQPYSSYHGYAITDHYAIDKRFGTNDQYLALASLCQAKGIKLIKDLVFNHVGHMHWFVQDIPSADWIHQFDTYTGSNHASPSLVDPNASYYDRQRMLNGWFDYSMPDLNQRQPQLAQYLIQHAIWWIEFAGVDGLRLDTYQFCDQEFMREMGRRVLNEYPGMYYFGETWVQGASIQSSFVRNSKTSENTDVMPGVTDFQWNFALKSAVSGDGSRHAGVNELYTTLAKDFLYQDPLHNFIFLDNHDMDRIAYTVGEDPDLLKSALSILLTSRGIPCIYYGTELGLSGPARPDGLVREDFPGGWPGDARDLFDMSQLNEAEAEIFRHITTLSEYRRESEAIRIGHTTQYAPAGGSGVYCYFRHTQDDMVLVIFNSSDVVQEVPTAPFRERLGNISYAEDVITKGVVSLYNSVSVPPRTTLVLEPVIDPAQ